MTDVNIPLLRKAVEWVEAEAARPVRKRQWFQELWITPEKDMVQADKRDAGCGTCYCVAGYVAQLIDERYVDTMNPKGMPCVDDFAAQQLGLDTRSYNGLRLFDAGNTAKDVRRIAEQLAGEKL